MKRIEERPGQVKFMTAIKDFFKGYVEFKGRSTRAGYWWIQLIGFVLGLLIFVPFIITLMMTALANNGTLEGWGIKAVMSFIIPLILLLLVSLALLLPTLALGVRRYRDAGLTNKAILLFYVINFISQVLMRFYEDSTAFTILSLIIIAVGFVLTVLPSGKLAQGDGNFFVVSHDHFYKDYEEQKN